jgi:hypothetical protein
MEIFFGTPATGDDMSAVFRIDAEFDTWILALSKVEQLKNKAARLGVEVVFSRNFPFWQLQNPPKRDGVPDRVNPCADGMLEPPSQRCFRPG